MKRIWLGLLLAFLGGAILACPCGVGVGTWWAGGKEAAKATGQASGKEQSALKVELTAEERARWKRRVAKERKEVADAIESWRRSNKKERDYQIKQIEEERFSCIAYSLKAKAWLSERSEDEPQLWENLPQRKHSQANAKARAEELARLPDVRCAAVIDFFSADDPIIVAWVLDAGSGPKTAPAPPPDLVQPFKAFMRHLQAAAD